MIDLADRSTQANRRARSRSALLEAAARGLSRHGYAKLVLQDVAAEAGYTRGALYHQFASKSDLALAVLDWVDATWTAEVGHVIDDEPDPAEALIAMARAHAVYCRRDVAGVMLSLRVEFDGHDHPVADALTRILSDLEATCTRLIDASRQRGTIPVGPPSAQVAAAYLGVLEAVGIALAGQAPADVTLAERAVRGLLGLPPADDS